jgi:hypothetical protein
MPSEGGPKDEAPWEGRYTFVTYEFAAKCAELRDSNPAGNVVALDDIMIYLATELWDRGFSQSEIKASFDQAITCLKPYCAGEERRGDRERAPSSN